jgi:hypothetical protein
MLHDCWGGRTEELKKMATSPMNLTTLFDKNSGLKSSLKKLPPHLCMNFFNNVFFQMHMTLTWMKIYVLDFLLTFTTHTLTCIDTLNLANF